jgi:hypothetical protein
MYVVKISNRFGIGSFQNHCMSREEACLTARWSSADKVACHVTLTDEVKKWASDGSRTLPQKLLQLRYQVPVYYFLLSAAARVFWVFFWVWPADMVYSFAVNPKWKWCQLWGIPFRTWNLATGIYLGAISKYFWKGQTLGYFQQTLGCP